MKVTLRQLELPEIQIPEIQPQIPTEVYEARCQSALEKGGCDWFVVYADREHAANIAFLTGFEPRFEEALFLIGKNHQRVIITGNESVSYTPRAGLPGISVLLSQSMSLLGQDRTVKPDLVSVLAEAGIRQGDIVGLAGWKYLTKSEWMSDRPTFHASAFVVDALYSAAGEGALRDVTDVLMHPSYGLRTRVDVHQIALQEWGAARASAAVWRMLSAARPAETELMAASRMGYAGEVLSAHIMFSSSNAAEGPVVGLASPGGRVLREGDGITTAVGYCGGLSSRAGLLSKMDDDFLNVAKAYFTGLVTWYQHADIGVEGGHLHDAVVSALAAGGLNSALNPGHLVGYDEWVSSPIYPASSERIVSGMPFQVDVIPTPVRVGAALNCEDAVTFADESLRNTLKTQYPDVWARIEQRRKFMATEIGLDLKPSILPLSNTPLCLPPFWLASSALLTLN